MARVHHSAITVRDVEASLRFWREGLGFEVLMDETFDGDWPTLFGAAGPRLRSVFLGDPAQPDGGVVELVDFGPGDDPGPPVPPPTGPPREGFLLLSVYCDVDAVLARLADLGLGGVPRRIESYGVAMAVVTEPSGCPVELIHLP